MTGEQALDEAEPEQANDNAMATGPAEIEAVGDLVEALRLNPPDAMTWYRGHSDERWKLVPSIARAPRTVDAELTLLKRFKQNAYPFLTRPPMDEWEWLFLMQHYGVPTRLLDWTESPLVGLYFAVCDTSSHDVDGCVWALQPVELNDAARLRPKYPLDVPLFGQDQELDNYLPTHIHHSPGMQSNTPAAGIAPRQFERVYAQMGCFTITHRDQTALQDVDGHRLAKYRLPATAKEGILEELRHLRVTQLTVFPELSNVALRAQEGLW
jgi:hypothetical protein